ncbi:MAG: cell division protein FtsL [Gammaproteobacteria bacterium]|nr:cell division protein FtsL [Gammaproteobacteria bacterium]
MRSVQAVLILAVVVSALGVVYVRHQHRLEFVALHAAHKERDRLNTEWRQLLAEESTWSFHHLVEKNARERLTMKEPKVSEVVIVDMSGR